MVRRFFIMGAIFGFASVAFGAFGAHALEATLEANGRIDTYDTAIYYLMFHALALFVVAWLYAQFDARLVVWSGYLLSGGTIIFSVSLGLLAVLDMGVMGAIAPIGGSLLLGGWACLGIAGWRGLAGES